MPPTKDDNDITDDTPDEREHAISRPHPSQTAQSICRVSVHSLFGRYSYCIPEPSDTRDLRSLLILYGDNGSGKTTLLKLIYHALSPQDNRGHRSYLANTRFSKLIIELSNGVAFVAARPNGVDLGDYELTLSRGAVTISQCEIRSEKSEHKYRVKGATDQPSLSIFIKDLANVVPRMHFLSDDRRYQGDLDEDSDTPSIASEKDILASVNQRLVESAVRGRIPSNVERAITAVEHLFLRQVRRGSIRGTGNVSTIYSDVATEIAKAQPVETERVRIEAGKLTNALSSLQETSKEYSKYGLSSQLPIAPLVDSINNASDQSIGILYAVLKPYVDSVQARLDALNDTYSLMSRFVDAMNSFYRDKHVSCHADKGITIKAGGETLDPAALSSGEQQLMLLFCNSILARSISKHSSTLFLIDEPELSLNVKWQRKLVQSLLEMAGHRNVQFVLATHSMELLSQHKSNVVKLEDNAAGPATR